MHGGHDHSSSRGGTLRFGRMGLGGAPIGNMNRALSEGEAAAVVEAAWKAGARYFDTAPLYGHGLSELRIGAALAGKPRGNFILSSKVGRLLDPCRVGQEGSGIYVDTPPFCVAYDYSYDGVMRSFAESRARLGMPIDLLFVHDLDPVTHGDDVERHWRDLLQRGGWRALHELRRAGDVAAIGAGMNECGSCERLLREADPDVILLAGRLTLLDQSALETLLPACISHAASVVIGGAFNSGILATGTRPGARFGYAPAPARVMERVRDLEAVCAAHDVKLADAALQFPLRFRGVVSVLQGGQTPEEVRRNAAALDAPIPDRFWEAMRALGVRTAQC